jgi:hypothetical protein
MRSIAKEQFRSSVLELRGLKSRVSDQQFWLRKERGELLRSNASRKELRPVNEALIKAHERLSDTNKNLSKTFMDAGKQVGPKFAGFLRNASDEALNLGSSLKATNKRMREFTELSREYMRARAEGKATIGSPLPNPGLTPADPSKTFGAPPALGSKPKGQSPRGTGGVPRPRVRKRAGGNEPLAAFGHTGDVVHQTVLSLDGKVIAESVTRHATKAANRS